VVGVVVVVDVVLVVVVTVDLVVVVVVVVGTVVTVVDEVEVDKIFTKIKLNVQIKVIVT